MGLNRKEKNNFVGGFWGFPNSLKPYKLFLLTWKLNFQDGKIETRYTDKDTCLGSSVQRWPLHASGTVDGSGDGKGCRCPFGVRVGTIRGGRRGRREETLQMFLTPSPVIENVLFRCFLVLISGTSILRKILERNTDFLCVNYPPCQYYDLVTLWGK